MRKSNLISCLLLVATASLTACAQKKQYTSPAGYDFSRPEKFFLPESLTEISGIAFHKGNPDSMYAIQDEEGKLFYFKPGIKSVTYSKYGKHGDYEDLAICNNTVTILKSNGTLYSFPFSEARNDEPENVKEWKGLLPAGEYEGLYADNSANLIYVLGKNLKEDKGKRRVSGFVFRFVTADSLAPAGNFAVHMNQQIKSMPEKAVHPSALSKNELTKEWYILSSVNKALIVADANWQVKTVYPLDPRIFHHPEGIAFDRDNNLYISNEGDDATAANLLKFSYRKP